MTIPSAAPRTGSRSVRTQSASSRPGSPTTQIGDLPAHADRRAPCRREGRVPAIDDQAADHQAEPAAEVDAARVDREHGRAAARRKGVGEHREGRRRRARLADADADARRGELAEAAREARERRHQAPEGEADRDQRAPVPDVGEPPERNAEDRVEDGEGGAVEEADLGVAHAEVGFDVLGQDRDDLAVEEVEDVDEHQHAEQVIRVGAADLGRGLGLAVRCGRARLARPRLGGARHRGIVAASHGPMCGTLRAWGSFRARPCCSPPHAPGSRRASSRPTPGLLARFEALRGRPYPWLLDSSLPSARLGRWSFAGAEPYAVLRVRGERCELECRRAVRPGLRVGLRPAATRPRSSCCARSRRRRRRPSARWRRRSSAARSAISATSWPGASRRCPLRSRGRSRTARCRAAARRPGARARPRERRQLRARPRLRRRRRERARERRARRARRAKRCRPRRRARWRPASEARSEPKASGGGGAGYARAVTARLDRSRLREGDRARRTRRSRRATSTRPASRTASSATSRATPGRSTCALRRRNPAPFACFSRAAGGRRSSAARPSASCAVDADGPRREPADQGHAAARRRSRRGRARSGARCSRPRRIAPRT